MTTHVIGSHLVTKIKGYASHGNDLMIDHPGRIGTNGFDKDLSLSEIVRIAIENDCNFILRASPDAKWYIKTKRTAEYIEDLFSTGKHLSCYGARKNRKSVIYIISNLE